MDTKKVLVVDDEPAILSAMSEVLRLEGFDVETAVDGLEAIEAAEKFHPDAMVVDVMMPRENGYRVSRAVKSAANGDAPKVLLVTARRLDDDPEREELFLKFSMADGILYKPFRLDDLLGRVRQLLG